MDESIAVGATSPTIVVTVPSGNEIFIYTRFVGTGAKSVTITPDMQTPVVVANCPDNITSNTYSFRNNSSSSINVTIASVGYLVPCGQSPLAQASMTPIAASWCSQDGKVGNTLYGIGPSPYQDTIGITVVVQIGVPINVVP
ncbi:MAG: hypothetical protein JST22_04155 [Bacteroidetes bacterium]|nr:hypothetical protein [Bacteroidota bacterium]